MAREFNGANQYCEVNSTPITSEPLTLACWAKCHRNNNWDVAFALCEEAGQHSHFLQFRGLVAGDPVAAVSYDDANWRIAESTIGFTPNQWHHVCGVFTNANSRTIYLDGGNSATDNNACNVTDIDSISAGTFLWNGGFNNPFDGAVAECAIWNVALTASEAIMLAAGFCPLMIRPGSLLCYYPFGGIYGQNDNDSCGSYDMTPINAPTWTDHPTKLIYRNSGIVVPTVAAVLERSWAWAALGSVHAAAQ